MGRLLFFILWPLIWVYAPLVRRSRAVIISDGKILLVKNWLGPGKWRLPGGGVKMSESVVGAVKRELREELGLNTKKFVEMHKGAVIQRQFGLMMRCHFTLIKDVDHNTKLVISKEIIDAEWFDLKNLENVAPEVLHGLAYSSKV